MRHISDYPLVKHNYIEEKIAFMTWLLSSKFTAGHEHDATIFTQSLGLCVPTIDLADATYGLSGRCSPFSDSEA